MPRIKKYMKKFKNSSRSVYKRKRKVREREQRKKKKGLLVIYANIIKT
jgi:hypothetical protein